MLSTNLMELKSMLNNQVMSLADLAKLVNKSKVTVWRWWSKDKILPEPILLNGKCLGWKTSVITQWLDDNQGSK
jgi:prophage regulatory protein